jgi:hypothetical protein
MSVGIDLIAKFKGDGISEAIKKFKELEGAGAKANFALKKAVIPAAAALTALTAAAGLSVNAAIEDEMAKTRLATVVKNLTGATESQLVAVDSSIAAMSKQTGIASGVLRPAFESLVVATGSVSKAQDYMGLAMDISAGTGADLATVTDALSKAHNGQVKGLLALDPSLKAVTDKSKNLSDVTAHLQKTFGGSEAAFEKTAAGGLRKLQTTMGDFSESIGYILLPFLNAILPPLQAFGDWAVEHADMFATMAAGVAAFAAVILVANAYLKVMAIWEAIVAGLDPFKVWMVVIAAVVAVVVMLYKRFEIVRTVINAVANAGIAAFEMLVNKWIDVANVIIKGINLLIKAANLFGAGLTEVGEISDVTFGRIGGGAKKAGDGIKASSDRLQAQADAFAENKKIGEDSYGGITKAVKTAAEKFAEFTDKLRGASDAKKKVSDAAQKVVDAEQKVADALHKTTLAFNDIAKAQHDVENAQRDVTKANEAVTKAMADVVKAQHDVENAQRDVIKADNDVTKALADVGKAHESVSKAMTDAAKTTLDVDKAQKKLKTTTVDVGKAQKALDEAVNGYSLNSKKGLSAQKELNKAQRESERSSYDLEKAAFDIADAEAELAAGRIDGTLTAQDIREQEIALAEAKLALVDSQQDQIDKQNDLAEATTKYNETLNGVTVESTTYKDLLKELNDAKDKQTEASQAVTDAQTAEAEATLAIRDALVAEQEAVTAVEDAKHALEEAVLAVAEAQQAEADANTAVADAQYEVSEALLAVQEAQEAVTEAVLDHEAAKRDEAAATRDVASAKYDEANAILDMARAEAELNAQRKLTPKIIAGNATAAFNAAMALANSAFGGSVPATFAASMADNLFADGGMPRMASGGIVTRPTIAMIGESGAEAIIPLSQMNSMGGNINITVNAGMGVNGAELGQQIIDEIRKSERRSGRVFAAA